MALQFTHIKSGRTFAAREGSRLAKLMAKGDGYEPYSEPEVTDVEKMNLAQLKTYADEQGIELTSKRKAEVLAEIQAAEGAGADDGQGAGDGSGDS